MSNKILYALAFLCFLMSIPLFGQGEANIWYFGENAGLDFNGGTPPTHYWMVR